VLPIYDKKLSVIDEDYEDVSGEDKFDKGLLHTLQSQSTNPTLF
jgi:hypothetical protein